jgi:hypothetical protein
MGLHVPLACPAFLRSQETPGLGSSPELRGCSVNFGPQFVPVYEEGFELNDCWGPSELWKYPFHTFQGTFFMPAIWILQLLIHLVATDVLPVDGISIVFIAWKFPGQLLGALFEIENSYVACWMDDQIVNQ